MMYRYTDRNTINVNIITGRWWDSLNTADYQSEINPVSCICSNWVATVCFALSGQQRALFFSHRGEQGWRGREGSSLHRDTNTRASQLPFLTRSCAGNSRRFTLSSSAGSLMCCASACACCPSGGWPWRSGCILFSGWGQEVVARAVRASEERIVSTRPRELGWTRTSTSLTPRPPDSQSPALPALMTLQTLLIYGLGITLGSVALFSSQGESRVGFRRRSSQV